MRKSEITPTLIDLSKRAKELGFPPDAEAGYLQDEFDNLYRSAHDGYLPTDEEFECDLHHCPELYYQIKHLLQANAQSATERTKPKVSREWIMERYNEAFGMKPIWSACIDFAIKMLTELGIEVTDK